MRITVPAFTGLNKRIAIQRLGDSVASEATDCDFRSGDLRGYLDDAPAGTTVYHDISGVTIFDYSPTQELVANGDWDIVRSPVVNDTYKRVYFSKYDPGSTTNYVGIIESRNVQDQNGGLAVLSSTKRLGVPKPADIYIPPTYEIRQGDVFGASLSTNSDATVKVLPTLAAQLDKGIKLIVSAPGFPITGLSITDVNLTGTGDGLAVVTLAGNKKVWKNCDVVKITPPSTTTPKVFKTSITFRLSNHGLVNGDQVVVSRRKAPAQNAVNQGWPTLFPTTAGSTLWSVTVIDLHNFSLDGLNVTANATEAGTVIADPPTVKFSVFAPTSVSFGNPSTVSVNNSTDVTQSSVTNFTSSTTSLGTWVDAAAIDTLRSRSYCITYVNSYGDESAPSTPTNPFDVVPGSPVTFGPNSFTVTSGVPGWSMNDVTDLIEVRLYRTDETGTFRLVTTDSLSTDSTKYNIIKVYRTGTTQTIQTKSDGNIFVDKLTDAQLGEPLTTTGWYPPPQGVQGIISAPNGVIAGFKGKTLYASVPYVPYAYPVAYQTATDADIMGLVTTGSGIAVLTKQMPYIMIGSDPSSWSMIKLEVPAACVSHASIVDMGTFGIYAGPEGLMAITGAEVRNLTQDLLTRAQWQLYNPTSIIGGHSEGRYVGSYIATDGTRKSFIFDTVTGDFADLSLSAVGFYTDLYSDTLKFVDNAGNIKQWNRGSTRKPYNWTSKVFELGKPSTFGIAQLISPSEVYATATLTLKLYGWDGALTTLLATFGAAVGVTPAGMYPLPNVTPFRIPVTPRYTAYKLSLQGDVSVATVSFASTMDELKEV